MPTIPVASSGPGPTRSAKRDEIMGPMDQVLRFNGSVKRDSAIEAWMNQHTGPLGTIARRWFDVIRDRGEDVSELLHDGHPTACIGDAAFAYVNAFRDHVNVGFFRGAELVDPRRLLEGTGKYMRHVKLRPETDIDAAAIAELIESAYIDMKRRLATTTRVHSTTRLTGIAPQFLVDDLERAMAYYRDKLGFAVDFVYESFYASVSRDGLAIHLKHAATLPGERAHRQQNEHLDAHVAVVGVEALYQELQNRGARITNPIGARPWECVDFYVEDADGYVLCFSEQKSAS